MTSVDAWRHCDTIPRGSDESPRRALRSAFGQSFRHSLEDGGAYEWNAPSSRDSSSRGRMRIVLNIVGTLALLVGSVWILQGINILPGSFMTGQMEWAVTGAIVVVAALGLLGYANRGRPSTRGE
jgi:hypothetical protein